MSRKLTLLIVVLIMATSPMLAQSDAPVVTSSAEYDIGLDCPIAQTRSDALAGRSRFVGADAGLL